MKNKLGSLWEVMESNGKEALWTIKQEVSLARKRATNIMASTSECSLLVSKSGWFWLDKRKYPIPEDLRGMSLKNRMLLYLLISNTLYTKR